MAKKTEEKSKLETILDELNKTYGAGTIIAGNGRVGEFDVIPTGSWNLDLATGIGGLPRGRIVEFIGPESAGKTTVALHVIAEAQKKGLVAFIDAEHALDTEYARKIGVDTENLLISQPDYGEQALEVAKKLASSGELVAIVVDSVAALVPKGEYDGNVGDASMGKQARMMSQALRMMTSIGAKGNTLLIFINQIRKNIGGYGNPEVGTGGEALKFYASIRIDIRRRNEKEEERSKTICTVMKNKCGKPFNKGEFYIDWGVGINKINEIVDLGIDKGIIEKAGSWLSYNNEESNRHLKVQGEDKLADLLIDNPELKEEIIAKIKEKL
jgi:recombination protein RecA